MTTSPEEATTAENEEPDENIDQPEEPEPVQEEPQQQEPQTEPEPAYKYKNGTYEGTAYGYAGDVHVSITIENDYITGFTAYADDDDPEYFSDAMQYVIPQIQSSMSADGIDSCSGATYSSGGLIEASRDALSKALN